METSLTLPRKRTKALVESVPEGISQNLQLEQDEKKNDLQSDTDSEDSSDTATSVIEKGT